MFGLEDLFAPKIQCMACNKHISLGGDYFPTELICSNCGNVISIRNLSYKYPRLNFDKDARLIK